MKQNEASPRLAIQELDVEFLNHELDSVVAALTTVAEGLASSMPDLDASARMCGS